MTKTKNLMRLQLAVDDAALHRQRAPETEKKDIPYPKAAEDVRYLYLGPKYFISLEQWVKSFKDSRRRDWHRIKEAMEALTLDDARHAQAYFLLNPPPDHD